MQVLSSILAVLLIQASAMPEGARGSAPVPAVRDEITIFDSYGTPTAYIAPEDELTLYLWSGRPVAYLVPEDGAFSIFGFNGSHLGWLDEGLVRDHEGDAVGFLNGAVSIVTRFEPYKSFRQFRPFRAFRQFAPFRPADSTQWSRMPLELFLEAGR